MSEQTGLSDEPSEKLLATLRQHYAPPVLTAQERERWRTQLDVRPARGGRWLWMLGLAAALTAGLALWLVWAGPSWRGTTQPWPVRSASLSPSTPDPWTDAVLLTDVDEDNDPDALDEDDELIQEYELLASLVK